MTIATLQSILRYPVKGLSPETLDEIDVAVNETLPFDRRFAIENGPSGFRSEAPDYLPKIRFLMLMKNEGLARYRTRFEPDTFVLTISDGSRALVSGSLESEKGRQALEGWFAETFSDELRGPPRILQAPGHSFSDVPAKWLHIVNMQSLNALEKIVGTSLSPLRFRPNLIIDGPPPWSEFDWIDRTIACGDVRLTGMHRTQRCAATNVEPDSGSRDQDIPRTLMREFGHSDFGIYANVATAGRLVAGESITVID